MGCCRPQLGGWGSDDDDNDPRGNDNVDNVRPRQPHTTKNLSDLEKRDILDEEKGGGRLLWK